MDYYEFAACLHQGQLCSLSLGLGLKIEAAAHCIHVAAMIGAFMRVLTKGPLPKKGETTKKSKNT